MKRQGDGANLTALFRNIFYVVCLQYLFVNNTSYSVGGGVVVVDNDDFSAYARHFERRSRCTNIVEKMSHVLKLLSVVVVASLTLIVTPAAGSRHHHHRSTTVQGWFYFS